MKRKKKKLLHVLFLVLLLLMCLATAQGCVGKLPDLDKRAREKAALAEKARKFPLMKLPVKEIGPAELSVFNREKYTADPAWSPDGKKVAYVVIRINKEQGSLEPVRSVYVSGAEGENPVLIAENSYSPSWLPDGKGLLFVSYTPETPEKESVWFSNADGSGKRQLTRESGSNPVLSPDGRKCAFLKREVDSGSVSLWVVDLKSSAEVKIASEVSWDRASWLPDGRNLAFISEDEDPHQVAIVGVDGKGFKKLTNMLSVCSQPSVSPDGRKVLFVQVREEGYEGPDTGEIFSADTRGGEPQGVLVGQGWEGPVWSPDGRHFACGGEAVAIVDYETKDRVILATELGFCWDPAWSPDGTKVFLHVPESEWGGKLYRLKLKKGAETYPLYLVICGSYTASYPDAYNLVSALQSQVTFLPPGFPKIESSDLYADLAPGFSMVLGGRYTTREQAEGVASQLKSAGFSPSVRKADTSDISDFFPAGAIIKKVVYLDLDKDKKSEVVIAFETTNGAEWQDYLTVLHRDGDIFKKILEQGFQSAGFDNFANLMVTDINKDGFVEICAHWVYGDSVEKFCVYKAQAEGVFLLQEFNGDQGLTYQFVDGKLQLQTRNRTGRRGNRVLVENWQWTTDRFEVVSSEVIAP